MKAKTMPDSGEDVEQQECSITAGALTGTWEDSLVDS